MVSSKILVITVSVFTLTLVTAASFIGDPCTFMPRKLPDLNEVKDVFTNTDCQNGSIWWNYPRGSLRVHFRYKDQDQEFRVCLSNDIGPYFGAAFDVTGHQHTMFPLPQGLTAETCTQSVAKEVILEVDMPSFQTYMTLYKYRLDFV